MEKIEIRKQKGKPNKIGLFMWLLLVGSLGVAFILYKPEKIVKVIEPVKPIEPPCYCVLNEYTKEICKDEYKWDKLIAVATMFAESGGNINAINHNKNGTVDLSLFQINEIWIKEFSLLDLTDPIKNINTANKIWQRNGWNSWVAVGTDRWMELLTKLENCSYGKEK